MSHTRWIAALVVIALLVVSFAACSTDEKDAGSSGSATGGIDVKDAWVRATAPQAAPDAATPGAAMGDMASDETGRVSGAFMILENTSSTDERLVAASVPADVAGKVEIHETTIDENDVMRMRPVDGITIPAKGNTVLKPGSYHIMLLDVQKDLNPGDTVPITLTFESGLTLDVQAEVRPLE